MENTEYTLTPAERSYKHHIECVKRYQKEHPEKAKEYTMRYLKKIRAENPEKHEQMKQKKRDYYQNVVKPRMMEELANQMFNMEEVDVDNECYDNDSSSSDKKENNDDTTEKYEIDKTKAEKFYQNHLKTVAKYQRNNKEKMRSKNKVYFDKLKNEKPEEYEKLLQKKRDYYHNIVKPKMAAAAAAAAAANNT